MRGGVAVLVTGGLLAVTVAARAAYAPPKDPLLEARIQDEIQARDPDGAELFSKANAARDAGDRATAAGLYEQVRARDPWFVHATRRLCGVSAEAGDRARAVALCQEAYDRDPSSLDAAALAQVLLGGRGGSASDGTRALALATEATRKSPGDFYAQFVLCQAALRANDLGALSSGAAAALRLEPDDPFALYFTAIVEATHGQLDAARAELERARQRGLPPELYSDLRRGIDDAKPPLVRYGIRALEVTGAWLAVLALLLVAGNLLSASTLRAATRVSGEAGGRAAGASALLRSAYRTVLMLACAFYYLSLPLVVVSGFVLFAGIGYASLLSGHVPIGLLLSLGLMALASVWAMGRSLFVRVRDEPPGERLDLALHPALRRVLDEVAARVGTRPVDTVYLTPGTDVAVLERGGLLRQVRGGAERCLVLGAAVLEGLRVRELKAILAHEYGHFQNEDTAGGGFALAVRRSLVSFAVHLARGRAASLLNPAWWFVRGFNRVFHGISQGATRLQEILADRWAAAAYGSESFSRGLAHVVACSARFDAHLAATLGEVVPSRQPLANLYAFAPARPADSREIDGKVASAMSRPASPYDSHPRPADRIAWVTQLAATGAPRSEDDEHDAWSLLTDRESIERRMTGEVWVRLARRGIAVVPAA